MCRAQWSEWQGVYTPRPRPRYPPEITTLTARSITYLGSEIQIDIQREHNRIDYETETQRCCNAVAVILRVKPKKWCRGGFRL